MNGADLLPLQDGLPLRDIHLPDAVSWWPPAYGWWVIALLLVVLPLAWWIARRRPGHRRATRVRRLALRELDALEGRYRRSGDARAAVAGASIVLRRVALSLAPREQVAALTGARWVHWLRRQHGGDTLQSVAALADRAYRPEPELDVTTLIAECRAFVRAAGPAGDTG